MKEMLGVAASVKINGEWELIYFPNWNIGINVPEKVFVFCIFMTI